MPNTFEQENTINNNTLRVCVASVGKKIPIPLPNTGVLTRRKHSLWLRSMVIIIIVLFAILQFHIISQSKSVSSVRHSFVHICIIY